MIKHGVVSSCGLLFATFLFVPRAPAITVQVATSKPQYYIGETVLVLVTVPEVANLSFFTSCQAGFILDGTPPPPPICFQVLTSQITPHTWTNIYHWDEPRLALGDHSVVGEVVGYGFSAFTNFQIIPPPPPSGDFLIDFDTIPGTGAGVAHLMAYDACGVHFHTIQNRPCTLDVSTNPTNNCLKGFDSYPVGFNVAVTFDMPVFGASAKVRAGLGQQVTMTAKNALGQTLAFSTSPPVTNVNVFQHTVSVTTTEPIVTLVWQPTAANAGVSIDDLLVITTPPLKPSLIDATTLRLICPTVAGANYQLWSSTNLQTWIPCGPAWPGDGNPLTNDVPVSSSSLFFRITKDK